MAKPIQDGTLSGAIGNVVFVNKGDYTYARSKPGKIKQTAGTKAAASTFGWVSQQDKTYRRALTQAYPLVTDSYYAARHRATMAKALNPTLGATTPASSLASNMPQALEGFEFNSQVPWAKTCHFYIEVNQTDNNTVDCLIPALNLGQNIKPPKAVRSALLQLHAFTVNPNKPDIDITPLSSHETTLQPHKTIPEALWQFPMPSEKGWLLILGTVTFKFEQAHVDNKLQGSATYLFAKEV
ncbi:hypothetical protein [Confluentibacter sediminis]|uniref:hypothetical protein n=1 Tax=Confluentibacter sediminis TaxID=2219045 RepID=UPI000DABFF45|nr:hypothetical protein [Confluentibacter sediminis]